MRKSQTVIFRAPGGGCAPHLIPGTLTAIVGKQIHGSLFWAVVDFFFYPIALVKWLICQEINLTIVKQAFAFLAQ